MSTTSSDVARILATFRSYHPHQPGEVWDPRAGKYQAGALEPFAGSVISSYHSEPKCQAVAAALPGAPLARHACGCLTCSRELEEIGALHLSTSEY